ncbi:MAG: hypothetical protein JWN94_3486 [Betaproteobacteria bacterium]|nr:hypothetical protein [Betaproteobacteria bacterium]
MAMTESPDGTRSTTIVDSSLSTWTIDWTRLLMNGVDTIGRGSIFLYLNRTVYALGTDGNWWAFVAMGNWRYVGSDPGQAGTSNESAEGTRGGTIVDSSGATWTIQSRVMLRNGVDTGGRGTIYLYHNRTVYALGTDNNWWAYVSIGSWQFVGADPAPASTGTESAEGTRGASVVDSSLVTWTIQSTMLMRAGIDTTGRGTTYLYHNHTVYALGTDNNWWLYDNASSSWKYVGSDPTQQATSATESAEGTRSITVVDAALVTWTIESTVLMRAGANSGGRGSIYLYHNHTVYALGTNNSYYLYDNATASWKFVGTDPTAQAAYLGSRTAVNLAPLGFWGNCDPFINRFKRATRWWHSFGVTKDQYTDQRTQWLRGIPPGETMSNLISVRDISGELDFTEQRSGTHYLLWQGPLTMSVAGIGVSVGRLVAPGKYAFEVPPTINVDGVPTLANPELSFTLVNQTQTPQDFVPTDVNGVQYPAIIHADDEGDFLAGRHYQRSFINSLSNAKYVRTMDWNMCPIGGVAPNGAVTVDTIEPANYYDETCHTYISSDDNRYFFPPEELGYLAREANVSVFNTINSKSSDATFDYWGSRFAAAAGGWNGELLSELGDENWNTAWPWIIGNRYLIDRISPSISVVDQRGNPSGAEVDRMGCATAARSLTLWNIMERYIPRGRHKRVLGGQFAAGIDRSGMGGMFAYIDPATGQRAHELADYYAVAPYWTADREDGLNLNTILQQRLWQAGDQFWIDRCKSNIDKMQVWLGYNKQFLATYAPNLKLTCYEGGGWLWGENLPGQGNSLYPAAKEFDNYCRQFMDGEPGRIVTQYYWDTFINGNFLLLNQYFHIGYGLGFQMGLQNSQQRRDTPRQSLFRTLGG